jgi:hypothetical protein
VCYGFSAGVKGNEPALKNHRATLGFVLSIGTIPASFYKSLADALRKSPQRQAKYMPRLIFNVAGHAEQRRPSALRLAVLLAVAGDPRRQVVAPDFDHRCPNERRPKPGGRNGSGPWRRSKGPSRIKPAGLDRRGRMPGGFCNLRDQCRESITRRAQNFLDKSRLLC